MVYTEEGAYEIYEINIKAKLFFKSITVNMETKEHIRPLLIRVTKETKFKDR